MANCPLSTLPVPILAAEGGVPATWVAVGVLAAVLVAAIILYNQLVAMAVRVDNSWSDIDVQLKRRHDLIPNVVEAVKGYAGYEKETLEAVIAARAKAMGAHGAKDAAAAENALTGTLKSLFALAENYPQLKASDQFSHLQQQLASIEEALQGARRYYNATVRELNTSVRMFPWNLLAGAAGASSREFFEIANDAERAVPSVTLS
ncbi:MAG: LemA family protein [Planctomycetaceae bacterium]